MAAILDITVMFWHGKLHTLFSDLKYQVVVFIFTDCDVDGIYSMDEVCNFPCQNMTVTSKIAATFALLKMYLQTRKNVSAWTQIAVYTLNACV